MVGLTVKEWKIVNMLARGKSNKEISYETNCTSGTIDIQLITLRKKIGKNLGSRELVLECSKLSECIRS